MKKGLIQICDLYGLRLIRLTKNTGYKFIDSFDNVLIEIYVSGSVDVNGWDIGYYSEKNQCNDIEKKNVNCSTLREAATYLLTLLSEGNVLSYCHKYRVKNVGCDTLKNPVIFYPKMV